MRLLSKISQLQLTFSICSLICPLFFRIVHMTHKFKLNFINYKNGWVTLRDTNYLSVWIYFYNSRTNSLEISSTDSFLTVNSLQLTSTELYYLQLSAQLSTKQSSSFYISFPPFTRFPISLEISSTNSPVSINYFQLPCTELDCLQFSVQPFITQSSFFHTVSTVSLDI